MIDVWSFVAGIVVTFVFSGALALILGRIATSGADDDRRL